jgi:dihydroorotase
MNDILIKSGRVIDPANGIDKKADVLIKDGRIVKVIAKATPKDKARKTIDASGKLVTPGLIDLHVHCREPGHEEEETIASASAAAVAGGFTTICAMPNTHPPVDDDTAINYILQRSIDARRTRVLPIGCITKGRAGEEMAEIGMMKQAGAVGFTDDGAGIASTSTMYRALQYASMLDVPLMQHCQDPELGGGVMNSGAVAVRLGLSGIPAAAETLMLQRDLELVARTNARYHVQHVSTAGGVALIRQAKKDGLPVTAEATPHHLLLTDACCMTFDPNYKMNPPLRGAEDVQALREAVADGTIDCLATDHAPHSQEEKELEFGLAPFGIISLECALPLYVKALVETGLMDWSDLIERMTVAPAAVIGRDYGSLAAGAIADVTVIDPKATWTVDVDAFESRSRNCPYDGWELTGRVETTIVDGEVRFQA